MPPHACAENTEKNTRVCQPSPQRYNKICINMLTHEKRLDWEMSRECQNGNGCGRRTATHGETVYTAVKTWNLCTRIKNVESEKIEWTCENENEKKNPKNKYGTKRYGKKKNGRRRRCRRTWREWVRWLAEYQECRQLRCPEDFRAPVWRASSSARSGCATPMMIC